MNKKLLHGKNY